MHLTATSRWLTWFAFVHGAIAFVLVLAYLRPMDTGTWANTAMALIVLAAPLAARPPATMRRLLICASVWAGVGVPGAYIFGSPIFYAGCLLGVVVAARLFLARERGSVGA